MIDKGFSVGDVVIYRDPRDRFYSEQVRQCFSLLSRKEVEAVTVGREIWIPHAAAIPHGGISRGTSSSPHTRVDGFRKVSILRMRPPTHARPKRFEYHADGKRQVCGYITVDAVMLQQWFWRADEDRLQELRRRLPVSIGAQIAPSVA